jgi:K+-sensing histidine kinase KdpD
VVKTQDDRKALRQRERRIKRRRRKELLTYIKEEVNHILQINNRMLSFSNLTQENTYGQIDVNEVLKNCVSALYTQRTKKKLSIETKMGADLPLVRAENADIQQIFFNLLFSAFDNAKEKGKIQVDSHYDDQAGEIVVDFEHEGSGNVLDDRQLCLQINGREKGQIDIPFLMAKKMVLDCGGQLFIQEREDGGSVRTVKFPCS